MNGLDDSERRGLPSERRVLRGMRDDHEPPRNEHAPTCQARNDRHGLRRAEQGTVRGKLGSRGRDDDRRVDGDGPVEQALEPELRQLAASHDGSRLGVHELDMRRGSGRRNRRAAVGRRIRFGFRVARGPGGHARSREFGCRERGRRPDGCRSRRPFGVGTDRARSSPEQQPRHEADRHRRDPERDRTAASGSHGRKTTPSASAPRPRRPARRGRSRRSASRPPSPSGCGARPAGRPPSPGAGRRRAASRSSRSPG